MPAPEPRRARTSSVFLDVPVLWGIIAVLAGVVVAQLWYVLSLPIAPSGSDPEAGIYKKARGDMEGILCAVDASITPEDLAQVQAAAQGYVASFAVSHDVGPQTAGVLAGFVEEYVSANNTLRLLQSVGLQDAASVGSALEAERARAVMGASILLGDTLGATFEEGLYTRWTETWTRVDARRAGSGGR